MWDDADTGPYDEDRTDKDKIEDEIAVPCRLCENAFRRLRLTLRYCMQCQRGFCDGEHGNFLITGRPPKAIGRCVQCGPHA
jgi:hypothetical protein